MELFSDFFVQPHENFYKKCVHYLQDKRGSFSLALYVSIFFHSVLFVIFSLFALSSPPPSAAHLSDQRAIFQAVREESGLTESQEKGLTELLKGFDISGYHLSDEEKKQLYQKLIASYTLIGDDQLKEEPAREITRDDLIRFIRQEGGFGLKSGKKVIPSVSANKNQKAKLSVLPKPTIKNLQSLQKFPYKDIDYYVSRGNVWVSSPTGVKVVPSQYFFRKSPFEQILAQGNQLFYIVEGFPVLEEKPPSDVRYVDMKSENIFQKKASGGFQVFLLSGLSGSSDRQLAEIQEVRDELEISPTLEEHFDKFCDDFLVLPEEQQFKYFRTNYLEKFDLNSEGLVYLTGKFIHKNLNNIIIPISKISSTFDYLEELYFNKPQDQQFLKFWRDYPDTYTGAQILLTLASHYDFERRTIENLYKAYDDANRYLHQKYRVSEVFNKQTKCFVIQQIFKKLDRELRKKGYASVDEVTQQYIGEQIKIYDIVIGIGGNIRNSGLYDLGCLYWDLNLRDLAIDTWAQIDGSYESEALDSIRETLSWFDDAENAHAMIDNILSWYATEGIDQRLKRLLDLGKWKARRNAIR